MAFGSERRHSTRCSDVSLLTVLLLIAVAGGSAPAKAEDATKTGAVGTWTVSDGTAPAETFDLKSWKLTLPELDPENGKAAEIKEDALEGYVHPIWFYTDKKDGALVFKTPNHLATTKNSSNTRSELREMVRAGNTDIGTKDPGNNWVISTNPNAADYSAIGGVLSATLAVDWVSTSGDETKFSAHSVVIGQIHGSRKMEPLKIFYRKLPGHEKGSLFWNYESNPADQDDRQDVSNDVWGSHTLTEASGEPEDGIALGEKFSYEVNISGTEMALTFTKEDGTVATFTHDLSKGLASIPDDEGYSGDWMYFKAGAYNQCNLGTEGPWGPACQNRGEEAGDYAQARFFDLKVEHPDEPGA